mmetsp:Transcript_56010/g.119100  ORF Transcript_56010/g.119100 Transcript_56010/m.119100 type:complete len:125 (+) Transcript_56010:91-465(+)
MKSFNIAFILGAIAAHQTRAFQPSLSRRALLRRVAATGGAAIATSSGTLLPLPTVASAAESKDAKRKKELLRGGKNMSDALHNGTDLNARESAAASGLLDKMGLADITPDKGPSARAPPAPRKR